MNQTPPQRPMLPRVCAAILVILGVATFVSADVRVDLAIAAGAVLVAIAVRELVNRGLINLVEGACLGVLGWTGRVREARAAEERRNRDRREQLVAEGFAR